MTLIASSRRNLDFYYWRLEFSLMSTPLPMTLKKGKSEIKIESKFSLDISQDLS